MGVVPQQSLIGYLVRVEVRGEVRSRITEHLFDRPGAFLGQFEFGPTSSQRFLIRGGEVLLFSAPRREERRIFV
jgi:hypothetical protein